MKNNSIKSVAFSALFVAIVAMSGCNANPESKLDAYLKKDILPNYPWLNYEEQINIDNYVNATEAPNAIKEMSNTAFAEINDYDGDGNTEMFVGIIDGKNFCFEMYEVEKNKVVKSAVTQSEEPINYNSEHSSRFLYQKNMNKDGCYFVERNTGLYCMVADGQKYGISVFHYDGKDFVQDLQEGFAGSAFIDMDNEINQIAYQLKTFGFDKTADSLDYRLNVKDTEDNLTTLFIAEAINPEVYLNHEIDYNNLSNQKLQMKFYRTMKDYRDEYTFTGYNVDTKDFSVSSEDGKQKIEAVFPLVQMTGAGSLANTKVNEKLYAMEQEYAQRTESEINQEFAWLKQSPYPEDQWRFDTKALDFVYYDDKGNVSVSYSWDWYMGGVHNFGWNTFNCNVCGDDISLYTLLKADHSGALNMICTALENEYEIPYMQSRSLLENEYQFNYAFDAENVYVYFDPYSLEQGGFGLRVTLQRAK